MHRFYVYILSKWYREQSGRLPFPIFWLQPFEETGAAWSSTDLSGEAALEQRVGRAGRGTPSREEQAGKLKRTKGFACSREKAQNET